MPDSDKIDDQDKTPTARKARPRPAQGQRLGRGLSALMDDVRLDDVVRDDDTNKNSAQGKQVDQPIDRDEDSRVTSDKPHAIASTSAAATASGLAIVAMDQLVRNPDQPRKVFNARQIEELAESIRRNGVLQPILVRPIPNRTAGAEAVPMYQIVAGERRWQAAGKANVESLPVVIRALSDEETLEIGIVENVQRQDLNPIEEAQAYQTLINQFGRTQDEIAQAIGKSRPHVANLLRLLTLPERVQSYVGEKQLSMGHARTLVGAPDPVALAEMIIHRGLSVREAEAEIKKLKDPAPSHTRAARDADKSADMRHYEKMMSELTGMSVELRHKGPGGEIIFKYRNLDVLEDMHRRLEGKPPHN